jgi:hypothetical protein
MKHCRKVLEWKELCLSSEESGSEAANCIPFFSSQKTGRLKLECAGVIPARVIEASTQMMFDTALVIRRRAFILRSNQADEA